MDDRSPLLEAQRLSRKTICSPLLVVDLFEKEEWSLREAFRALARLAAMRTVRPQRFWKRRSPSWRSCGGKGRHDVVTKKQTISARLDAAAKQQVERVASIRGQSSGAFLEQAGDEHARQVRIAWAVDRHRRGEASFSELAAETGLAIEEIMLAIGSLGEQKGLDLFLASCRTAAEASGNPDLLNLGEGAVQLVQSEHAPELSEGWTSLLLSDAPTTQREPNCNSVRAESPVVRWIV